MKYVLSGAGVLLIGAALCLAGGCKKQSKQPPPPVAVVEPSPGAPGLHASGQPAISPPASGQISDSQVRNFVMSHHVPRAEAKNISIVSTSFISSAQVSSLLHTAKIDVADSAPTCLVVMSGDFVFSGPPGRTFKFPIAIEVFDAKTGNLLQYGGMAHAPQTSPPR
jgi:hypothetical protein